MKYFFLAYFGLLNVFYAPMLYAGSERHMSYFQEGNKGFNLGSGRNSVLSKRDFIRLKSKGFQVFRVNLRLNYSLVSNQFELTNLSELFLNKVHQDLESLQLKLIISVIVHKEDWLRSDFKDKLSDFWKKMAIQFRLDETVIAYDILNEPVPPSSSHVENERIWNGIATSVIQEIRAIDNKVIVYEPAPWGLPKGFKWLKPLEFENIVYSFHMYSPHKFTHQGIKKYKKGLYYPSVKEGWDIKYLRERINPVISFQKRHQVPIYIGEFSAVRYAPGNSRELYIKDLLQIWKENGWSWSFHSFKEWDGWDPEITSQIPSVKHRNPESNIMKMLVDY